MVKFYASYYESDSDSVASVNPALKLNLCFGPFSRLPVATTGTTSLEFSYRAFLYPLHYFGRVKHPFIMLHQERKPLKFSRNIFLTLRKKVVKEIKESDVSIPSDKKQKEIVVTLEAWDWGNLSFACDKPQAMF